MFKFLNTILSVLMNDFGGDVVQQEGAVEQETTPQQETSGGSDSEVPAGQETTQTGQTEQVEVDWQSKATEIEEKYNEMKNKTTQTEQSLSATRKAIEKLGFSVASDPYGNIHVIPSQTQKANLRFSDDHRNKFASYFPNQESAHGFLELLNTYLEDFADNRFNQYDQKQGQVSQFKQAQSEAEEHMLSLYPQLNQKSEGFDKRFYDRASEIYLSKYVKIPNGELIAAHEVAMEMNISPSSVAKAQKEGFLKGKESKQVLGPVTTTQTKQAGGGFKRLSYDEYKALSPVDKEAYNKKEIESRKK